jgi:NAD(P)-dependent dehydrogenase (short-subunit alcohol dehydrogenase family)
MALDGQVAVIAGSSRGIGRAVAPGLVPQATGTLLTADAGFTLGNG